MQEHNNWVDINVFAIGTTLVMIWGKIKRDDEFDERVPEDYFE